MKIREYLVEKYQTEKPTTITKAEAVLFEIPYPLQHGWLERYGDKWIQSHVMADIEKKMQRRFASQRKNGSKKAAHTERALQIVSKGKIVYERQRKAATADSFLTSYEWRCVRMAALKKYGPRCQCCGATPRDGVKMHVDHIKPRNVYPELALDVNNLQILCELCNHGKGNWDMTDWRKGAVKHEA